MPDQGNLEHMPSVTDGDPSNPPSAATAPDQLAIIYPWLPPAVIAAYTKAWNGGAVDPWAIVRQDPLYEEWFPGNSIEGGGVRYSELVYARKREEYRDVLRSVDLKPDNFEDAITDMIRGERTPEEFAAGVHDVYNRIISASDEIKQYYADLLNITDLSTASLIAAYLDPANADEILSGKIDVALIGGSALEKGFNILPDLAKQLEGEGLVRSTASDLFGRAAGLVPILDILAKRHNDPDDDFDINEFLAADFFKDPVQNLRMRRALSRERASFSGGSRLRQSQSGAGVGLLTE